MADAEGGHYRVGWKLGEGDWEPWTAIPDWQPGEGNGLGADVADLDGDGRPELLVLDRGRADDRLGARRDGPRRRRLGPVERSAAAAARPRNTAAAFVCLIDGERPELMALGSGAVAAQPVEADEDPAEAGTWRILDHSSQILAVHAALMHTGDVLWFAGSGADPDDHEAGRFRTRVWHYPSRRFSSPRTPIDLFCAGQTLPRGRPAAGRRRHRPVHAVPRHPRRPGLRPRGPALDPRPAHAASRAGTRRSSRSATAASSRSPAAAPRASSCSTRRASRPARAGAGCRRRG